MEVVQHALAAYGATLGLQGVIIRNEKATGVAVVVKGKRIRFESTGSGHLLASGPVAASTVEKFVESFWFWKKA
ncbi:MAG: hypothetical protein WC322_04185 [Candidatus Paceibacterota bacterium]